MNELSRRTLTKGMKAHRQKILPGETYGWILSVPRWYYSRNDGWTASDRNTRNRYDRASVIAVVFKELLRTLALVSYTCDFVRYLAWSVFVSACTSYSGSEVVFQVSSV